MKKLITLLSLFTIVFGDIVNAQIIPNGTIDNIDELILKDTVYTVTSDGTQLATDVYFPVFQDSVTTDIDINGSTYTIQIIPKNSQFIVYDTSNFSPDNYSLPLIFTRTPYNKTSDDVGGKLFPFLGFSYAIQDMRGRYESEGVYFPMYSDAWAKYEYHPGVTIPMDVTTTSDPNNALFHHDGSEAIYFLSDSIERVADFDHDGVLDTIQLNNGNIGMYGASALGNSQYQALSDIPFLNNSPLKCMMPIVATNEHYNTTLFHNGVYRNSLTNGWLTGQMTNGVDNNLNGTDNSIFNNLHSPSDYNYADKAVLANDLIDWFVADHQGSSPSGAHPTSVLRKDLDASLAPINTSGISDASGSLSRYQNLNKPMYHLTGWWDIFINGQIETYRRTKKEHSGLQQKLVIGPWTHQTIGTKNVGDVVYPDNVYDILNIDLNVNPATALTNGDFLHNVYTSELLAWFRKYLGGEPFFIIPESDVWQPLGGDMIRVPAENYVVPYYEFLNFIGGVAPLDDVPVEINSGGNLSTFNYSLPALSPPLVNLSQPLTAVDTSVFDNSQDIRMYITGPTSDSDNPNTGNFWHESDSLPFYKNIENEVFYLHQNQEANSNAPVQNEGDLSYIADPNDPVITIGGNNMIPSVPNGSQKSQGSMNVADPNYINLTMDRSDVLSFETAPLADTMTFIGFPKAKVYAKGHTTTFATSKTDFDVMVRVVDVYPDGREMLITEGVVNAKSRHYAKSISDLDTNENIVLDNIDNDTYHYFEFDLLPLGHTFGKFHQIKFLISSSNYPKYQSNPHVPNEAGEFFRWSPGSADTYDYNGQTLMAQNAEITYNFNASTPSMITMPKWTNPSASIAKQKSDVKQVKLFPNPAKESVNILLTQPYSGNITISNVSGQMMESFTINHKSQINWDVRNYPSGVYFVQFEGLNIVKKLVVQ